MKKLIIALAIVLVAATVNAQTWHTADSVTFAWGAVAPIQPTDQMSYQVYTKFRTLDAVPQAVGTPTVETQMTVRFTVEGRYYLCVQTVRLPDGETVPLVSDTVCSHQAEYCANGQTFGVKYFVKPDPPHGLK